MKPAKKKKPEAKKTFVSWLLKQKDRTDPIGQLAKETAAMIGSDGAIETYKVVKIQMHRHRASQVAMASLKMAHAEYQGGQYIPRKNFGGFN